MQQAGLLRTADISGRPDRRQANALNGRFEEGAETLECVDPGLMFQKDKRFTVLQNRTDPLQVNSGIKDTRGKLKQTNGCGDSQRNGFAVFYYASLLQMVQASAYRF